MSKLLVCSSLHCFKLSTFYNYYPDQDMDHSPNQNPKNLYHGSFQSLSPPRKGKHYSDVNYHVLV
jgi:hypothetical protein